MKNSLSSTKVILLAIFAILALAAWIFVLQQSYSHKSEVAVIEREAKEKSDESTYLLSIRSALRDAEGDIQVIRNRFIAKDAISDYIGLIEGKAESSGVNVEFGGIDDNEETLSIRMSGSGTWANIVDFVSAVDSMPYASRIDSLNISKPVNSTSTTTAPIWNFNMHLVQYLDFKEVEPQK